MKICFYDVDLKYVNHIKNFEKKERGFSCVPNIQYNSGKNKFVYGAVLQVSGMNYFVPVSSKAHDKQDDIQIKVKDKKNTIVGTLRFAYMIPIPQKCLTLHDISIISDYTEKERCRKELAFCRKNKEKIQKQAEKTYNRIKGIVDPRYKNNCCDFEILERALVDYCTRNNIEFKEQEIQQTDKLTRIQQENSLLKQENMNLKTENAMLKEVNDKRANSIHTANLILSSNPELKEKFVKEKQKLTNNISNPRTNTMDKSKHKR